MDKSCFNEKNLIILLILLVILGEFYYNCSLNTKIMNFNLSTLLEVVNRNSGTTVDLLLSKESKVILKAGETVYTFDNEKLEDVLKDHSFNYFHRPDTAEKINEVLSKHIINQLTIERLKNGTNS